MDKCDGCAMNVWWDHLPDTDRAIINAIVTGECFITKVHRPQLTGCWDERDIYSVFVKPQPLNREK